MTQLPLILLRPVAHRSCSLTPCVTRAKYPFVGGVVAGLEPIITPGLFLRAEWEFIAFASVNGARNNLNTGSVGPACDSRKLHGARLIRAQFQRQLTTVDRG